MSFDIFLQRFQDGEAARADEAALLAVLEPLIDERGDDWARLRTSDGDADVHGLDDPASSLMVNHASGHQIWSVLFTLAYTAGFAMMPVGCGTFVVSEDALAHLPDGMPEPIQILTSGDDLRRAVAPG